MKSNKHFYLTALCLVFAFSASAAFATDKAGKDSTKRLQQMLRQSQQEKAQLLQQKTEAEGQLKESQDNLDVIQKKAASMNAKVVTQARDIESLKKEKEELVARIALTEKQLADTGAKLSQTESDKRGLETAGAKQRESIATCEGKNIKLYQYGNEILSAYENRGCGSVFLQAEPVTGLKRVEVENMVEEYRDKIGDQKITAGEAKATDKINGG